MARSATCRSYGESKKGYRGGTKVRTRTTKTEWIVVERPDLAIFDPELWGAVQARAGRNRTAYGFSAKRGPRKHHLLSGLVRCGVCGGPMQSETAKHGSKSVKVYHCSYSKKRGATVCTNNVRRPTEGIDDAIIEWVQRNVLKEAAVEALIKAVRQRLKARSATSGHDLTKLEGQATKLRKEIGNLAASLASMGTSKALTEALADRERQLEAIVGRIEASKAAPGAVDLECARLERDARARIADLKRLLAGDPAQAHRAMEALFDGPLRFTPLRTDDGPAYRIEGRIATGAVLSLAPKEASPRGFEPRLPT